MLAAAVTFSMDGRGRFLDNIFIERLWRSLKYEAVYLHELRDGLERRTHHWFLDRLPQRGAPALVPSRTDAGRGLSRRRGGAARTTRRDAIHEAQPAQRRLRAWRDCRAPVPSFFPSAASPDGKTEVMFRPGSGESVRTGRLGTPAVPGQTCSAPAQARSQRALETIGIHLKIALGLSNEVGPPHKSLIEYVNAGPGSCPSYRVSVMPVGARRDLMNLPDDLWTKVNIEFYRDAEDGVFKVFE